MQSDGRGLLRILNPIPPSPILPTRALRLAGFLCLWCFVALTPVFAQSANSGTIRGTVLDPAGAAVKGAEVEIQNPVAHVDMKTQTGELGDFRIDNIPFNPYHLTVTASGFQTVAQDIDIRSSVPLELKLPLQVAGSSNEVNVTPGAADLLENDSTAHTDVARELFNKLPLESASSELSSLVTLASPGVAADSNGLMHGLGDHNSDSFSLDGEPITDQQNKVFSNQIPLDAIQSLQVIEGAPPARFGGKTSLVIDITTRSGQGVTTPHGDVFGSYGTFGTSNEGFNLAYGGKTWGNFVSVNGLNTGRFLDTPEFQVLHDHGNEENFFDRVDYQFSPADTIHININYTRSSFQNPNTFDQEYHPDAVNPITGGPLGSADQRSLIKTIDIAPAFQHIINPEALFTIGLWYRQDQYNYFPSANPLDDYAPDLQSESITQSRRLLNTGARTTLSYVKGIHNVKAGVQYMQTFLTEGDSIGIVDPAVLPSFNCLEPNGQAEPGTPCAVLLPHDLTRGGASFPFYGHTDIKEASAYIQDQITTGPWAFNLGLRGDKYDGLSKGEQLEPRLGIAYDLKPTNTVFRVSYARTLESPFNENLVIASEGCNSSFLAILIPPPGVTCNLGAIQPGYRNEFHAGLEQAFGKYLVLDGEYIWKYTHNGYDFGVVGATPITFPIEWTKNKIPGFAVRLSVPETHGFSAQVVMSHVAARFFAPQVAGVPIIPPVSGVFRIDHDEIFNQTTHLQYQPWKQGPWLGFNWRYDSGLVAGPTPCVADTATCLPSTPISEGGLADIPAGDVALVNASTGQPLTADQEFQSGLTCNGRPAVTSPFSKPLAVCGASGLGSMFLTIPAPFTENDDHNPQRVAPRNLFDIAVGHDNIFHGEKYKWSARVSVINLADKVALYNFLSTFSGTHYVSPRAITATIGFHF
ncbi:MAG TPA: TonB-dependent receptor [Blastocatellia bacterium]